MTDRSVYISGAGIISSIGANKQETLESLLAEKSGIGPMRHLKTEHTNLPVGEVRQTNEELRQMLNLPDEMLSGRTALLGAVAIREAMDEAKLGDVDLSQVPLISGTTVGGMDCTEDFFQEMQNSDNHLAALASHGCGATSNLMARFVGMEGSPVYTVSTACSSAANAIIMGANLIKTGRADIVIAGGAEALSRFHLNGFNTLMILDNERCRPFDATRRGLNLGEGAGYVVLESGASIQRRGITPMAILSGYGNACDAHHQTASSEDGEGAFLAISQALRMAGVDAGQVSYVNAHGTGTPNNDQSESVAIGRTFGEHVPPVSSTKSFTGHTTSASGSIEAVICLLAMQHGFIPANLGFQHAMEEGIVPTHGIHHIDLEHIMCNSFGFGGNDSSLLISKVGTNLSVFEPRSQRKVYVKAISSLAADQPNEHVKDFVAPLEARRMCKLLKAALVTSLSALQQAGVETPDAIITGTTLGMLETSEKFLLQMCQEGEQCLGPTLFMQSTHNTIGGMLGIKTKAHGYNITYTQNDHSLRTLLLDALMQFELTDVENVLVGCHDETTELFSELIYRLTGVRLPVGQSSVSIVLSTRPERALCPFEMEKLIKELDSINVLAALPVLS